MRIQNDGNIGIGTTAITSPLTVNGLVESVGSGGFKFPDGTVQTTAASLDSVLAAGNGSQRDMTVNNLSVSTNLGVGGNQTVNGSISIGGLSLNANGLVIDRTTDPNSPDTIPTEITLIDRDNALNTNGGSVGTRLVFAGDKWNNAAEHYDERAMIESVSDGGAMGINGGSLTFYTAQSLWPGTMWPRMHINCDGYVGIGTPNPGAALEVAGQVKISGGSPGAGKILTSDGNGLATWQAPAAIPSGVIVMWSGLLSNIPSGWALCDGSNGTPDLRDKFIYGSSAGQNPGGTGGAASHIHSMGNAEVRFGPNTGQIGDPAGRFTEFDTRDGFEQAMGGGSLSYYFRGGQGSGPGVNHRYLQLQNPDTGSGSSLPPYYKLAYIMKL
jgi:hypothetical protein